VQLSSRVVRPLAPLAAAGCSLRRRLRFQPRRDAFREARPEVFAEMFVLRPACAVPMRRAPMRRAAPKRPAPTSRSGARRGSGNAARPGAAWLARDAAADRNAAAKALATRGRCRMPTMHRGPARARCAL